jgi:uncharacterized protein (DUF885 family)
MTRTILAVALAGATLALVATPAARAADPSGAAARGNAVAALAERYWNDRLAEQPDWATLQGVHDYDARLRDLSPATVQKTIAGLVEWQKRFAAVDDKALSLEDAIDLVSLRQDVRSALVFYQVTRNWQRQPRLYSSTAINSIYTIVKRSFAPLDARLRSVIAREQQIPELVRAAKQNLSDVPRISVELALQELPSNIEFLQKDTVQAFASVKDAALQQKLAAATDGAARALRDFGEWMRTGLLPRAKPDFAIGEAAFVAKLAAEEMLTDPLDRVLAAGEAELKRLHDAFVATAKTIDPKKSPEAVQQAILADHPGADHVIPDVQARLAGLRAFLVDHGIVSVPSPGMPIVQESPPFMRAFTLASMDPPGPYEQGATEVYYNVTLPSPTWSAAEVDSYLRGAFSRPVIEVTSIHEAFPGHYLQFQWMPKMRSKTRKLYNCASNVEGWAHYTEQMMVDEGVGGADPRLRLAQLQEALLRATRYVAGIRMHTRGMTLAQAIELFQKQGMQSHAVAEMEAKRGTEDPTYLYYTWGKLQILKLRDEYKQKQGAQFSLRKFHDAFLAEGAIPLPLMRRALLEQLGR